MNGPVFSAFTEPIAMLKRSPGIFLPDEGVFSRLFPELLPHDPGGRDPVARLKNLGKRLYDDGSPDSHLPSNPSLPAAYTFFAQFVAHDMSFDPSRFGQRTPDGVAQANLRTPRLDLDHVYGGDPDLNLNYYEFDERRSNTYCFRIGGHDVRVGRRTLWQEDLPRHEGRALIPDQRDDQQVIVNQMHLAFLKLHNVLMRRLAPVTADQQATKNESPRATFVKAQRMVRWYYQFVIVEDLLPRLLGSAGMPTFDAYRERWMDWQRWMVEPPAVAAVPVEFSVGAYRIAHSSLRSLYQVNGKADPLPLFPKALPAGPTSKPTSLLGGTPLHRSLTVSWERLLPVPGRGQVLQRARAFGRTLSAAFSNIPVSPNPGGLAEIDLERGLRLGLPSGQAVARRLGLDEHDIQPGNDPLWYYCMKEVRNGGASVGPVAAAIISKVFLDLLHLDPTSYLFQQPSWRPSDLPSPRNGLTDLLRLAGMPFSDDERFKELPARPRS